MQRMPPNSTVEMVVPENGEEMFVISGRFTKFTKSCIEVDSYLCLFFSSGDVSDSLGCHVQHSWTRRPVSENVTRVAGPNGCFLWFKVGHLSSPEVGVNIVGQK